MKTQWLLLLLFVFLFNFCHLAIAEEGTSSLPAEVSSAMQDEDVLTILEQAVIENKPDMILAAIMKLRDRWKINPAIYQKIEFVLQKRTFRAIVFNL